MKRRVAALLMAVVATLLSLLIFQVPQYAGVWQRMMFVLSFGWLTELLWNPYWQMRLAKRQ